MGSLRTNYDRWKQLENITDKSYLDFSEAYSENSIFMITL